jgi:hypothetical protein
MTTTLNTSCSENTMVLSARRGVSACMHVFSSKIVNQNVLTALTSDALILEYLFHHIAYCSY